MQNLKYLLDTVAGTTLSKRYIEVIDILVDIYGSNLEQIEDLTMSECERYTPEQAIHALNSMLFDVIEKFFLNLGITLADSFFDEDRLVLLFDIFEATVRLDGYELYDELLAILDDAEETDEAIDREDLFVTLASKTHRFNINEALEYIEEVDETFFEVIREEIEFLKKSYENSFALDDSELRVFKIHPLVRDVLRRIKAESPLLECIKRKEAISDEVINELKLVLLSMDVEEAAYQIILCTLLSYPEEENIDVLKDIALKLVTTVPTDFELHVSISIVIKNTLPKLETLS